MFSKKDRSPEIAVEVKHGWYPDEVFTFYFPKRLPQSALDADDHFIGLKDDEREEVSRTALIDVVAKMSLREPEGFSDFPKDERPLPDRFKEYFNAPEYPELEAILIAAWRAYRVAALPKGFPKSLQNNSAAASSLSGATAET